MTILSKSLDYEILDFILLFFLGISNTEIEFYIYTIDFTVN